MSKKAFAASIRAGKRIRDVSIKKYPYIRSLEKKLAPDVYGIDFLIMVADKGDPALAGQKAVSSTFSGVITMQKGLNQKLAAALYGFELINLKNGNKYAKLNNKYIGQKPTAKGRKAYIEGAIKIEARAYAMKWKLNKETGGGKDKTLEAMLRIKGVKKALEKNNFDKATDLIGNYIIKSKPNYKVFEKNYGEHYDKFNESYKNVKEK